MRIAVAGGTGTVGRHVVDVLREQGHEPVVLARSTGVDLVAGTGIAAALAGVAVVIDVASLFTQKAEEARAFFSAETANLLDAEVAAGVGHHVLLGIIGSEHADYDYYAGKVAQERLVHEGRVPWTEVRAAQFHEFAAQIYGVAKLGPFVLTPKMRSQPVAAREVAERLVQLALAAPAGVVAELAGPREESVARMVRAYATATNRPSRVIQVPLPGPGGKGQRDGSLLPAPGADLGKQTFDEWIGTLRE